MRERSVDQEPVLVQSGDAATATGAVISVRDLQKVYPTAAGSVHALSNVSLEARRGEFVSILGPSGCGKSTLMMIVAGLRSRSAGSVHVEGVPVEGPVDRVGVVFQNDVLLDWRTILDNVLLQIECRGLPKDQYVDQARALLTSVGLEGFERHRPYELSGGMRQRVSISRALIHDPPLLLMDEPFGALDALTREQMMLDLQRVWLERHKTVLFITHSIPEAVFLSDRVIVMTPRPGEIDLELTIDLPRPRHLDVTGSERYQGYVDAIRDRFQARGVIRDV